MEPDDFWENQAGTEPETFREIEKFDSELSESDVMSRTQDGAAPMGTDRSSYYNQDKSADGKSGGLLYNSKTGGWYDPNNRNDKNHPDYIDARASGGTGSYFEEMYQNNKSMEEINRQNKFIENDGYSFANANTRKKQIERFGEDYEKLDSKYLGISQGLTENERLGVEDYSAEYREDNRFEKQGTGEVIWRGIKRAGMGLVYQTIGGIASTLDFEDYFNKDNEVGNFIQRWADEGNKEFQMDNQIYTGKNDSMASLNWWVKNGADLASSIGAFAIQGLGVGSAVSKGLSGLKTLARLGKAGKAVAGVAETAAGTGTGLSGSTIRAVDRAVDLTSDAITAIGLNQAESIMSAAPRYTEAYDDAIKRGHSEEYAKQVAAYAAQTVISTNRINFALNMTSVNKLMKASGVRAGNESAAKTWGQTLKNIGIESAQEAGEEVINNMSELAGKMAQEGILDKGANMKDQEVLGLKDSELTTFGDRALGGLKVLGTGASVGAGGLALSGVAAGNYAMMASNLGFAAALASSMDNGLRDGIVSGADLVTGKLGGVGNNGRNSWNEVDWEEAAMSAFMGAIGGAGQTVVTEGVVGNLGSDSGVMAKIPGVGKLSSKVFGKTKQAKYQSDSDQLDGYGEPLYRAGDEMYEMEDDVATKDVEYEVGTRVDKTIKVKEKVKDDKGNVVKEPILDEQGKPEMESTLDADGNVVKGSEKAKTKDKVVEKTLATKGQVITEEMLESFREKKILKEKKGEQRYQRDVTGALIEKPKKADDQNKEPEFVPSKRFKLDAKGRRIAVLEKNADGSNRKYSRNELDRVTRQEIITAMEPFRENIMTDNLLNQHVKYAKAISNAVNGIDVLMDRNIDTETRAVMIEKVANRLAVIQLTKTIPNFTDEQLEKEIDKQRSMLIQHQEDVPYLMAKQKELAKLDIARQALLSFETGTSETFKQLFRDIQKMPADKAKEKGYAEDYKEFAQKQIDKIERYQDMYTEYTGKHGKSVGKAMFMNRASYDSIMDMTNDTSEEIRENLQKRAENITKEIFNGNIKNKLEIEELIGKLTDLDADLKTEIDESNLKVNHNGKELSLVDANKEISKQVYDAEYDKKREEAIAQEKLFKKEVSGLQEEIKTLKAQSKPDENAVKIAENKLQKVKDEFKKNILDPFLDYNSKKKNEKADKIDKLNEAKKQKVDSIKKEYETKIKNLYSTFINDPLLDSDFSSKLSKASIESIIMNAVNELSSVQSKKQLMLQEAKELNDRFNRLRDSNEVDAEWKRQQEETATVRFMLAEIRERKKELADNQARFEQYKKDNPEFAARMIGSTSYEGVRYVEKREKITDGEEEVEIVSFEAQPYTYYGEIQEINGVQYFVPRDEAPFVIYEDSMLEQFKSVVIAGKEAQFEQIKKDIDKANEDLKVAFASLKKIKESKDILIQEKIDIEKLIQNPTNDTDVEKLTEDKKKIDAKIEELNRQYVPSLKDKERITKERTNLYALKNSLSYYSVTPKSETVGTQHEGYAIVAPRSYKDVSVMNGSKLKFTGERVDRTQNQNSQYEFVNVATTESNLSLENNQEARVVRLYVDGTNNASAVSANAEGSSIVLIESKRDSRPILSKKKKDERRDWAQKKTVEQITSIVNEIEILEGESEAIKEEWAKANIQDKIAGLISELYEFSSNAKEYFIEKSVKRMTKEEVIDRINKDNSAKYQENPEKHSLRFASPTINSEEGMVTPLFVDEDSMKEMELMTEAETFRFVNDLFTAKAVKSKSVIELRKSVISAIENKGKIAAKKGDSAAVKRINDLLNTLNSGQILYTASKEIQNTFAEIGFKARQYNINNFTSGLFTKKTEIAKSETGPSAEFIDKAVKMNGNVEQNRRTKQSLREYFDSLMSYDVITPDDAKGMFVKYGLQKMLNDRFQRAQFTSAKELENYQKLSDEFKGLNSAIENEERFRDAVTQNTQELISIARSAGYTQEDLIRMGLNEAEAELIYLLANDRLLAGISIENEADIVQETIGAVSEEYEKAKQNLQDIEVEIAEQDAIQQNNSNEIERLENHMNKAKANLNEVLAYKQRIKTLDESLAKTNTPFNPANPQNDARIREKNELMAKVDSEEKSANQQIAYAVSEIANYRKINSKVTATIESLRNSKKSTADIISSLKEKRNRMISVKSEYDIKVKEGSLQSSFVDFLDSKSKNLINQISDFEVLQKIHKGLIDNAVQNEIQEIVNKAKADAISYLKGDEKQVERIRENHKNFSNTAYTNFDSELDNLFEQALRVNREINEANTYESDLVFENLRAIREQWGKVKSATNYDIALAETVKLRALLSQSDSKVIIDSKLNDLNKEILTSYIVINTIDSSKSGEESFTFDKNFVKTEVKNAKLNIKSLAIAKAQLEFTNNYVADVAVKAKLINTTDAVLSSRITDIDDTNIDDVSELAKHRSELLARRAFIAKYIKNLDSIEELNVEIAKTKLTDKLSELESKGIESRNKIMALVQLAKEADEMIASIPGMTDEEAKARYKEYDLGTLLQELSKEKEKLRIAKEEYSNARRKISSASKYLANKGKKSKFDYDNVLTSEIEHYFALQEGKIEELRDLIEDAKAIDLFTVSELSNLSNNDRYDKFDEFNIFRSKTSRNDLGQSVKLLLKSKDEAFRTKIESLIESERILSKLISEDKSNYPSNSDVINALKDAKISEEDLNNNYLDEEGNIDVVKLYNEAIINLEKEVFDAVFNKQTEIDKTLNESINLVEGEDSENIKEFEGVKRTSIMFQMMSRLEKTSTLQETINEMRELRETMKKEEALLASVFTSDLETETDAATIKRRNVFATAMIYPELRAAVNKQALRIGASNRMKNELQPILDSSAEINNTVDKALEYFGLSVIERSKDYRTKIEATIEKLRFDTYTKALTDLFENNRQAFEGEMANVLKNVTSIKSTGDFNKDLSLIIANKNGNVANAILNSIRDIMIAKNIDRTAINKIITDALNLANIVNNHGKSYDLYLKKLTYIPSSFKDSDGKIFSAEKQLEIAKANSVNEKAIGKLQNKEYAYTKFVLENKLRQLRKAVNTMNSQSSDILLNQLPIVINKIDVASKEKAIIDANRKLFIEYISGVKSGVIKPSVTGATEAELMKFMSSIEKLAFKKELESTLLDDKTKAKVIESRLTAIVADMKEKASKKADAISELNAEKNKLEKDSRSRQSPASFLKEISIIELALERIDRPTLEFKNKMERATKTEIDKQIDVIKKYNYITSVSSEISYNEQKPENFNPENAEMYHVVRMRKEDALTTSNYTSNPNPSLRRWQALLHDILNSSTQGISMRYVHFTNELADSVEDSLGKEKEGSKSLLEIDNEMSKIEGNKRNIYAIPVIKEDGVIKYAMVKEGGAYSIEWVTEVDIASKNGEGYHLAYSNISGAEAVDRTGYNTFRKAYLNDAKISVADSNAHPMAAFNTRLAKVTELLNVEFLKSEQQYIIRQFTYGDGEFFSNLQKGKEIKINDYVVDPLFIFALAESNLGIYEDENSRDEALKNLPIWQTLERINEGSQKWESGGRNQMLLLLQNSYGVYRDFKNTLSDQIGDFRNSVLGNTTPVFGAVDNIKMGSLRRNEKVNLTSVSNIFDEAQFMDRATVSIAGLNDFTSKFEDRYKGVPIIRMNGMNVEAYAENMNDNDIVLTMQLLNEALANRADNESGTGARSFKKPIFDINGNETGLEHSSNIIGKDQYGNYGSLHKLIRMTNPSKDIVPGVTLFFDKGLKFGVYENGMKKLLTLSKADLNALGDAKNETDLKNLYEASILKNTNLHKFIDFMRNKRNNILYVPEKRVSESNKYYHPVLINGVNGVIAYDSYKEFLYKTDRIKLNVVKHNVPGLEKYATATAYAVLNNNLENDVKTAAEIQAQKKKLLEAAAKAREAKEIERLKEVANKAIKSNNIPEIKSVIETVKKANKPELSNVLTELENKVNSLSNEIEEAKKKAIAETAAKNKPKDAIPDNTTATVKVEKADSNGIIVQDGVTVVINMRSYDDYLLDLKPFRSDNSVPLNLFASNNGNKGIDLNNVNPFAKIESVFEGSSRKSVFKGILADLKVLKMEDGKIQPDDNFINFANAVKKLENNILKTYLQTFIANIEGLGTFDARNSTDLNSLNSGLANAVNSILFDPNVFSEFTFNISSSKNNNNKQTLKDLNNRFLNDLFNNNVENDIISINDDVKNLLLNGEISEGSIIRLEEILNSNDALDTGLINLDSEIIEILINNGYIKQSLLELTKEYYTAVATAMNTSADKIGEENIKNNLNKFLEANRDLINAASFSPKGNIEADFKTLEARFNASQQTRNSHLLPTKNKNVTSIVENTKGTIKNKIEAVGKFLGEKSVFSETMLALAQNVNGKVGLEVVNTGSHRLVSSKDGKHWIELSRNNDRNDNARIAANIIHELIHANIAVGNTEAISKEIFQIAKEFANSNLSYEYLSNFAKTKNDWRRILAAFTIKGVPSNIGSLVSKNDDSYTEESIRKLIEEIKTNINKADNNPQVAEEFITYVFDSREFATMLNETKANDGKSLLSKLLDVFVKYLRTFAGIDVKVGSYLDKVLNVAPFLNEVRMKEESSDVASNNPPVNLDSENPLGGETSNDEQTSDDVIQSNSPVVKTIKNVTFGQSSNLNGSNLPNEDALFVDVEEGLFILSDGIGGNGSITVSAREASKAIVDSLRGVDNKNTADIIYEAYLKNNDISVDEVISMLKDRGIKVPKSLKGIVKKLIDAFKNKETIEPSQNTPTGLTMGATSLKAQKISNNTYKIEKVGDTVFFVVDKNGNIKSQHGASKDNVTEKHSFYIKDGVPSIKNPAPYTEIILLEEGERLVLATDFIETDKAMQSFINSDYGKNIDFAKFQKENKYDDSTFITIEYEGDVKSQNNANEDSQSKKAPDAVTSISSPSKDLNNEIYSMKNTMYMYLPSAGNFNNRDSDVKELDSQYFIVGSNNADLASSASTATIGLNVKSEIAMKRMKALPRELIMSGIANDPMLVLNNDISELEIIPGEISRKGAGWEITKKIEIRLKNSNPAPQKVEIKDVNYYLKAVDSITSNIDPKIDEIRNDMVDLSAKEKLDVNKKISRRLKALSEKTIHFAIADDTKQSGTEQTEDKYQETIEDDKLQSQKERTELRNKIYSTEPNILMKYGEDDLKIDSAKMSHIMEGMTTLFMDRLRNRGILPGRNNVDLSMILNPNKMFSDEVITEEVDSEVTTKKVPFNFKKFYDDIFFELGSEGINEFDETDENEDFQFLLSALMDSGKDSLAIKKELIARFKREMKAFKINLSETFDEYSDADTSTKDYIHDRLHYLTSAYDMTDISIKLLVNGLPELQYLNGGVTYKKNQSGLPKLIDGNKMFNLLQNYLNDAPVGGEIDALDALEKLYKDTVEMATKGNKELTENEMMILSLHKLFNAQVGGTDKPVNLLSIKKDGRLEDIDVQNMTLIGEFVQTFTKSQPNFTSATVQEDTVAISNATVLYGETSVINKWRDSIEAMQTLSGNQIYDVPKDPITTFEEMKSFWKSLGVNLSNRIDSDSYLLRYQEIKNDNTIGLVKDTESLREHLLTKADDPSSLKDFNIIDFMNNAAEADTSFANTIRNLSKVESTLTKSSESKKHQTADGNDIHGVNLHSEATVVAADMNGATSLKELKKSLPHLNSTYAKNSILLKRMFDSKTGNRNNGINIKFGYSSGLIDEAEGVVISDLKANDKLVLDLASISRKGSPLFPFLRSADRGSEMTMQLQDNSGYPIDLLQFTSDEQWLEVFEGYLFDEMNTIRNFTVDSLRIKNYASNGGKKFRLFDSSINDKGVDEGILGSMTKEFLEFASPSNLKTEAEIQEYIKSRRLELNKSLKTYFKRKTDEMIIWLRENDFIDDQFRMPLTEFKNNNGGHAKLAEALDTYIRKSLVGYVEQTKLVIGDPILYKSAADSFKRFKMFNATKKVSLLRDKIRKTLNNDMRITFEYENKAFDFIISNDENQRKNDFRIAKVLDKVMYNVDSLREEDLEFIKNLNAKLHTDIVNAIGKSAKAKFSPAWKADGEWSNKFNTIVMDDVEFTSSAVGTWSSRVKASGKKVGISDFNVKYNSESGISYFVGDEQLEVSEIGEMVLEFAEKFVKDGIKNNQVLSAKLRSYVEPYMKINEADAEAYCTLPFYKTLLMNSGKQWNEQLEKSYQKALRGELLSDDDYSNLELEGGFKGAFTKLKTHATGPLDSWREINEAGENVKFKDYTEESYVGEVPVAGYKHSLMPLLPALIKDTPLEALNRRLIDNNVHLAQFISAVKYGSIGTGKEGKEAKNHPFYDKDKTNDSSFSKGNLVYQTMDMKHIGIQVDMRPSFKEKVTAGTQFRKLIINGMFDRGIPADYREANQFKSEAILQKEWNALSDSQKELKSEMFKQSQEYTNIQTAIYNHHYKKLKEEFGMDYIDGKLTVKDRNGFVKAMISAMEEESKSINDIMSVKFLEQSENPIEILANSKNFMYMLYALVNNRVIKEKRKGEGSPQSAVTGWENSGSFDRADADSFLRSYRYNKDETAILPSECMVALPESLNKYVNSIGGLKVFNNRISDLLAKLKLIEEEGKGTMSDLTSEEKELKKLITLVGFRIPNQGLSSSDILRIVEFKPTEFGSTIIVPGNMTAKAGSDFDIDKLTMYSANFDVKKNKEGVLELSVTKYEGLENASIEQLQNRMIELHEEIMLHSTKLRQLLSPVSDALFLDDSIGVVWDIRFLAANPNNEHIKAYREALKELDSKGLDRESEEYKNERKTIYYQNKTAFVKEQKKNEENNASWNDIFVPLTNLKMFMAFLSGKTGVGIAALQNTFNVLSQRANLGIAKEDALFLFKHNKDEKGNPTFAALTSSDGDSIAETISSFINAYVDVAKDPFVFDINAGLYTSSTMFNLLRAGTSPVFVTRLLNQPIIKQFVKRIDASNSLSSKSKNGGNKQNEDDVFKAMVKDFFRGGFENERPNIEIARFFNAKDKLYLPTELDALKEKGMSSSDIKEKWLKENAKKVFEDTSKLFGTEEITEEQLEEMLYETDRLSVKYQLTESNRLVQKLGIKITAEDKLLLKKQFALLNMFLYYKWQADEMGSLARQSNYDTNGLGKTNATNRDKFAKVRSDDFKTDKTEEKKNKLYINGHKLIEGSMVARPESIAFEYYQAVTGMSVMYDMDKYPKLYSTVRKFQEGIVSEMPKFKNQEKYLAFSNNLEADFITAIVLSKENFQPSIVYDELFSYTNKSIYKSYSGQNISMVKYTHDLALIADVFANKADKQYLDFYESELSDVEIDKILDRIGFTSDKGTARVQLRKFLNDDKVQKLVNYFAQTNLFRDIKYKFAESDNRIANWAEMNSKTSISEIRGKTQVDYFNANLNRLTPKELNDHVTSMNALKELDVDFYNDMLRFSVNQSGLRDNRIHSMIKVFDSRDITNLKREYLTGLSDEQLEKAFNKFSKQIVSHDWKNLAWKQTMVFEDRGFENMNEEEEKSNRGSNMKANNRASKTPGLTLFNYKRTKKEEKNYTIELFEKSKDKNSDDRKVPIIGIPNHFFGIQIPVDKPLLLEDFSDTFIKWLASVTC